MKGCCRKILEDQARLAYHRCLSPHSPSPYYRLWLHWCQICDTCQNLDTLTGTDIINKITLRSSQKHLQGYRNAYLKSCLISPPSHFLVEGHGFLNMRWRGWQKFTTDRSAFCALRVAFCAFFQMLLTQAWLKGSTQTCSKMKPQKESIWKQSNEKVIDIWFALLAWKLI